jgi:hypothetical protein
MPQLAKSRGRVPEKPTCASNIPSLAPLVAANDCRKIRIIGVGLPRLFDSLTPSYDPETEVG